MKYTRLITAAALLMLAGSLPAATILFDLCDALHMDGHWNAVAYSTTGVHVPQAIDSTGQATTVSYECTDGFASFNTSGMDPTIYPVNAGKDSFSLSPADSTARIVLGGLTSGESYDLRFFGSRNAPGPRAIEITIDEGTQTLETAFNSDQVAEFIGVPCSAQGQIVIDLATSASSSYAYLGVIEITGSFEDAEIVGIYVAPDGDDAHPGTADEPVATMTGAAQRVREWKSSNGLPAGGLAVFFRGGTYCFDETCAFESGDSGQSGKPITYQAYPGETVRLTGALELDGTQLTLVTSGDAVWSRLDNAAKGQVMQMSLAGLGITEYGNPKAYPREIIFNDDLMQMARWPNDTYDLTVGPTGDDYFTYTGSRPERWLTAPDAYTSGHYSNGYFRSIAAIASIDTNAKKITLAENPIDRGVGQDKGWYVFNLLEEIDMPGEFYIDAANDKLYFWPPSDPDTATILLTHLGAEDARLFNISNANYLQFKNLICEGTRTRICRIAGQNLLFDGCTFRNAAGPGITGSPTETTIKNCQFYDLGKGGMGFFFAGDRKSLTPANVTITNNYITRLGRFKDGIEYTAGISTHTSCCGFTISHNHIENTPDIGIGIGGNNNIIEYNRLWHVSMDSHDMGATYSAGDWSSPYGSVVRCNEVYNNTSELPGSYGPSGVRGIYLDFWSSGVLVEGNILHTLDAQVMHTAGGHMNHYRNNVIVNAPIGHMSYYISSTTCETFLAPILEMDYNVPGSAWYEAFPFLTEIPDDCSDPCFPYYRVPRECIVDKTIAYNCPEFVSGASFDNGYFEVGADNLTDTDPMFIDEANQVFALRDDSPAYDIPGFKRICWERIGLLDTSKATRPIPLDGATAQDTTLNLYWAPALEATTHKVYLGIDSAAVANRATETLLDQRDDPNMTGLSFAPGTQYYWAVDEYDAQGQLMGQGDLWTFATVGSPGGSCDFNGDIEVNWSDIATLLTDWLSDCAAPGFCAGKDVDRDGRIDLRDFALCVQAAQMLNRFEDSFASPDYAPGSLDGQNGWNGVDYIVALAAASGNYPGGQAVSIAAHNVWANMTVLERRAELDPAAGPILMRLDTRISAESGLHLGLRAGTPDYGPTFGFDREGDDVRFIVREVNFGPTIYGAALNDADGDWVRILLSYNAVAGRLSLYAYNLTTGETMETGLIDVEVGAWDVAEAGMYVRHLVRVPGASTEVWFDNIVITQMP